MNREVSISSVCLSVQVSVHDDRKVCKEDRGRYRGFSDFSDNADVPGLRFAHSWKCDSRFKFEAFLCRILAVRSISKKNESKSFKNKQ